MSMTQEEIKVVAQRARVYPKGHGDKFVPGISNQRTLRDDYFLDHPEDIEKG